MNNNSQNQSPERKGHLRKLSAEEFEAISVRQPIRYKAYADMYKSVELSNQGNVNVMRQTQPEVIQNVAGVAIANESFQKTAPYPEIQPMTTERPAPVAQVAMTETMVADPAATTPTVANPLLAEAYKNLDNAYGQQELGRDDVAQAA
jgi:hypothetical protein